MGARRRLDWVRRGRISALLGDWRDDGASKRQNVETTQCRACARHPFFEEEAANIRDIRRVPIKCGGYSVSYRTGHASVRIDQETYKRLKVYLTDLAPRRSAERMAEEFRMIDFEPYAPIRRHLLNLLRAVNRVRRQAG